MENTILGCKLRVLLYSGVLFMGIFVPGVGDLIMFFLHAARMCVLFLQSD
jgi:hypothetical protein